MRHGLAASPVDPDGGEGASGILIASSDVPGGERLYLIRHGQDYEILLGDEQLMGSWAFGSEEALATLACERLEAERPAILIGGLGMGFTLAAARRAMPSGGRIVVAELVPAIVQWARGPLAHLFGGSLDDPRVSIVEGDVHDLIERADGAFDAILLDVDNGPDALVAIANERLYSAWGLRDAHAALRAGGILAVWSAYADDDFTARLRATGFAVQSLSIDPDGRGEEPPHTLWLARKPE